MKRLDVVGTGSMVVDQIHFAERIVGPDEKTLLVPGPSGRVEQRLVGGVALNHLGWAALLGASTAIFGKGADDTNGRVLRAGMRKLGIEASIDLTGSASSEAQVYVAPDGSRAIYMARGATAEFTPDEVGERHAELIGSAAMVTTEISQLPLATAIRTLELARAAGARTVLDIDVPLHDAVPALGSEAELWRLIELADVLKPAESALASLVSAKTVEERARTLRKRAGATAVVVTLGGEGSLVVVEAGSHAIRAAKADVIDTTGAGDAFLGGLLAGLARDFSWEDAAKLGSACGAACCERVGAFPDDPPVCRKRVAEAFTSLRGDALDRLSPLAEEAPGARALADFLERAPALLQGAADRVDPAMIGAASDHILAAESAGGRVHVTGVGKPEHLAHYAASLLASTGTPATFLHATEATHGSLGQLREGDVVVAISNSGTTPELTSRIPAIRDYGCTLIGVTSNGDSDLARASEVWLEARVDAEGGPLDLAPRASILAQLLVLAALSVDLQAKRGFTQNDYHRRHPGGALGKRSGSD